MNFNKISEHIMSESELIKRVSELEAENLALKPKTNDCGNIRTEIRKYNSDKSNVR